MVICLRVFWDDYGSSTTWFLQNDQGHVQNALTVLGTSLIIIAGTDVSNPINSLLQSKLFQVIGDYSYAIYIWHWPIIVFSSILITNPYLDKPIALVVVILASYLSHRFIEIPQLKIGRKNQVSSKLVGLLTLTLVASTLIFYAPNWVTPKAVNMKQNHIGDSKGCRNTNIDLLVERQCWFNGSNAESLISPIFLLGDSNADHFSEAAVSASLELHRPLYISNGCVFTELFVWNEVLGADWTIKCHKYVLKILENLKSEPPSLVVISNSDHYWTDNRGFPGYSGWAIGTTLNLKTKNPMEKLDLFRDSFSRTVNQLIYDGHKVLVIQTIPHFEIPRNEFDPYHCSTLSFLKDKCFMEMDEASALVVQGGVRKIILDLSADLGFSVIDPWVALCPKQACSTRINGEDVYRDGHHLSVAGSYIFKPAITKSILDNE